jgi:hypothetical protein
MAVFIGAVKSVNFGNFGTNSVAKRAWIVANYVDGSGYRGESLEDIKSYLQRQTKEKITKEKMNAALRYLFKAGYAFDDKKDYWKTRVFQNKRFLKGKR